MKKILGLILARGGSKGIKNKNIKRFCNKPLIYWTIKKALKSKMLTDIILSTDSSKIALFGKKFGANVPFLRPKKYASDKSSSIDAIEHAINFLKRSGKNYDYIFLLEPTSPFRDHNDIDRSIKKILSTNAEALISICKTEKHNPLFLFRRKDNDLLIAVEKSRKKYLRRQELSPVYFIDGSIYISKIKTLLSKRTFCHSKTIGFELPKWKSIEIDDTLDWILAETIHKKIYLKSNG